MSFFRRYIPFHSILPESFDCLITVLDYWSTFWFLDKHNFLSHVIFSITKTRNCHIRYKMYKGSLIFKNETKIK